MLLADVQRQPKHNSDPRAFYGQRKVELYLHGEACVSSSDIICQDDR